MSQATRPDATRAPDPVPPTGPAPVSGPVSVVVGPRTRLGQQLVQRLAPAGRVVVVSRGSGDASALAETGAEIVPADVPLELGPDATVHLYVCALGPVHPTDDAAPDLAADTSAADRDLAFVESVLRSTAADVRVVLVSTVIALAPGADRRYYGGWKGLVEQQVRTLVHDLRPDAGVSVLYPGRLVDGSPSLSQRLSTDYGRLATIAQRAAVRGTSRVVGLDARLWLARRLLSLTWAAVRPASLSSSAPSGALTSSTPRRGR